MNSYAKAINMAVSMGGLIHINQSSVSSEGNQGDKAPDMKLALNMYQRVARMSIFTPRPVFSISLTKTYGVESDFVIWLIGELLSFQCMYPCKICRFITLLVLCKQNTDQIFNIFHNFCTLNVFYRLDSCSHK